MRDLPGLLVLYRPDVLRFVERQAGSILRFETAEDLVQDIQLRALKYVDEFSFRGRKPFLKWIHEVARNHIRTRHAHWAALKRNPSGLLRFTQAAGSDPRAAVEPARTDTGPPTLAGRLEQASLAVRALDLLLDRDRELVRWAIDGVRSREMAERLQMTETAADRARQRAIERFRKAFRLLTT